MLQQTQVTTVIPYFERFMARFPDIQALAAASEDDVLHHWTGLGYYARARNLHRAARHVAHACLGQFPCQRESVEALPGVGRSTAGAILAQALDERHPILDGNVKRVLTRWAGIDGYPGEAATAAQLWALADALTPATRACDYTQAIMDLGATLCTRSRPRCADCPLSTDCCAKREGRQAVLPAVRPSRVRPVREVHWLLIADPAVPALLMRRRRSTGLWGGLYGFVEASDRVALANLAEQRFGTPLALQAVTPIRHAFSHFELIIHPWLGLPARVVEEVGETWYNLRQPPEIGLAAPVVALVQQCRRQFGLPDAT